VATTTPQVGPVALIRFLSELALLAAFAFSGAWIGDNVVVSLLLAVALPVAAAVIWGRFIGPKGRNRLSDPYRLGLELVLFGAAAVGLIAYGHWVSMVVLLGFYAVGTPHGRAGG
jgi:hypothetical protein